MSNPKVRQSRVRVLVALGAIFAVLATVRIASIAASTIEPEPPAPMKRSLILQCVPHDVDPLNFNRTSSPGVIIKGPFIVQYQRCEEV